MCFAFLLSYIRQHVFFVKLKNLVSGKITKINLIYKNMADVWVYNFMIYITSSGRQLL